MSESIGQPKQLSGDDVLAKLMNVERAQGYLDGLHRELEDSSSAMAGLIATRASVFRGYKMPNSMLTPSMEDVFIRHSQLFARATFSELMVPKFADRIARSLERALKPDPKVQPQPILHIANSKLSYFQGGNIVKGTGPEGEETRTYTIWETLNFDVGSNEFSGNLAAVRDNVLFVASDELDAVMMVYAVPRGSTRPDPNLQLSIEYPTPASD